MESLLKVIILAVIQGLTEFLPVSSSGHLALAKHYLGLSVPGALLEVSLHFGTLLAIVFYYHRSISRMVSGAIKGNNGSRRYLSTILVSMIPAAVLYYFYADGIEALFCKPIFSAAMLCVTGLMLLFSRFIPDGENRSITTGKGLGVGIAQALAIMPGISRSGITIVTARSMGIEKKEAARFSFLMAMPVLAGAGALQLPNVADGQTGDMTVLSIVVGVIVAAVVGYGAILLLLKALSRRCFWLFGLYCCVAGAVSLMLEVLGESLKV
ncbi:MAG: undecaprenyl-diphosphate phosphatase [Verrucomicrobiota bacterium]